MAHEEELYKTLYRFHPPQTLFGDRPSRSDDGSIHVLEALDKYVSFVEKYTVREMGDPLD